MRKVLVAGGSSFIGSSLIKYFNRNFPGFNVVNLDTHDGVSSRGLPVGEPESQYAFFRGDVADRERTWHHTVLAELIVNCVWSDVGIDPIDSNVYAETTIVGLSNLMQSACVRGTSRFLQVSTAGVYGTRPLDVRAAHEQDMLRPGDVSDATRAAAEMLVRGYRQQYDLGTLTVRLSNVYGPNMSKHELLPRLIKAMASGKASPAELDTALARDWIHVDDMCEAVDAVIHQGIVGGIYNVCSGEVISDAALAALVADAVGGMPAGRLAERPSLRGVIVSNDKIRKLGWTPKRTLKESLPALLDEYAH